MSRFTALSMAALALTAGCAANTEEPTDDGAGAAGDVVPAAGGAKATGGSSGSGGAKATGGSSGSGGAVGSGGTSGSGGIPGTGGTVTPPPAKVNDCSGLGAEGVFEDVTPPEVKAAFGTGKDGGGTFAIAADPVNQGTVYVGTLFQKVWKTTDCGANWTHISTGRNGSEVDAGMNWTFAVDPVEPNVVYTNSGYGWNGLFKSLNGGVDWDPVWPPPSQPELAKAFTYNFANVVAIDPSDHQHILLTFHESCLSPHPATCIAETLDAGSTWRLIDGQAGWNGNEGQVIFFLESSKAWLWGSSSNGFWRTSDSGASWQAIPGMTTSHRQGSGLVRTTAGAFFVAGADGIWGSPDGVASTWKLAPNTGPIVGGLVTDGSTMFSCTCYSANFCDAARYLRSAESDGLKWTQIPSPKFNDGGTLAYDKGHHLLFSSNFQVGLWRVVVR
jgi:hypothetical protein